jgi:hypothetical protein
VIKGGGCDFFFGSLSDRRGVGVGRGGGWGGGGGGGLRNV